MSKDWAELDTFYHSELFHNVQTSGLFSDSKTFADARPNFSWSEIFEAFEAQRSQPGFSLQHFVSTFFTLPEHQDVTLSATGLSWLSYLQSMWRTLRHEPGEHASASLITLPHAYIIPGGRFREIYYWDSYFTALGLHIDNEHELVKDMLNNFVYLQQKVGLIPNGNRSYYRTRSQPPVLALFVSLACSPREASNYINALEQEYTFWMGGQESLSEHQCAVNRVVSMPDGSVLNRYYDSSATPRPESYKEDVHLASSLPEHKRPEFYREIRAACESGWDFSARWLGDDASLASLRTSSIVPVDLNCLLYMLEDKLAELHARSDKQKSDWYKSQAEKRMQAIQTWCWNDDEGCYVDYDLSLGQPSRVVSAAMMLPLFSKIATQGQADKVTEILVGKLLKSGGVVTSLRETGQQWDEPNGWAPLQWFAFIGLKNYGFNRIAREVAKRWLDCTTQYFDRHQVMLEKYNVCEPDQQAGGGEYDVQLGFGWTNGVSRAFHHWLYEKQKE